MKAEHQFLSTIATLACKCADFHPVGTLSLASLFFIVLVRRKGPHGDQLYYFLAATVGVVSFVYAFCYGSDGRLESFLRRGTLVNGYYDRNAHRLPSSRLIANHTFRYANGQWRKVEQNESIVMRFRGVNLPAKTPSTPSYLSNTNNSKDFYASKKNASFIGRPFSLEEAPQHFNRISNQWGFNLIRLSTSWEAVMHEGPGIIDQEYIEYFKDLVVLAGQHGLYVLIDSHQDVWSRFSGGDGAPSWTLDAAGFNTDSSALHESGGAVLHQFWGDSGFGDFPKMMWPNNYWKLGTATMFTLFFAGDTYAPGITMEDVHPNGTKVDTPIQSFLQNHYLNFIDAVAKAVKDCPNVIGFGTMNEPSNGYVGVEDISSLHAPTLHGHTMSAFDSMILGSGESVEVPYYQSHFTYDAHNLLNAKGVNAYKSPELDVWQRVGVFKIDETTNKRVLLRPNHFALKPGEDFTHAYMMPFYESIQQTVSRHNPSFVIYAEPYIDPADPYPSAPSSLIQKNTNEQQLSSFGWAPHFYDFITLFLGNYNSWFSFDIQWNIPVVSPSIIDWTFRKNLQRFKEQSEGSMHVIVGETGVPFSGSEDDYTLALDRTLRAMEATDLDYVVWCYEVGNNNAHGDLWNGEDLSLLAEGKSRGLQAAVRPWPYRYSSGLLIVSQHFKAIDQSYQLVLREDGNDCADCSATVYVFVPSCQFHDPKFIVSPDSSVISYDRSTQNLKWEVRRQSAGSLYYLLKIIEG